MPKSSDLRIHLVMLELRARRLRGEIPDGEPVSIRFMEKVSHEIGFPVSQRSFSRAESRTLTRLKLALQALTQQTPNEN